MRSRGQAWRWISCRTLKECALEWMVVVALVKSDAFTTTILRAHTVAHALFRLEWGFRTTKRLRARPHLSLQAATFMLLLGHSNNGSQDTWMYYFLFKLDTVLHQSNSLAAVGISPSTSFSKKLYCPSFCQSLVHTGEKRRYGEITWNKTLGLQWACEQRHHDMNRPMFVPSFINQLTTYRHTKISILFSY